MFSLISISALVCPDTYELRDLDDGNHRKFFPHRKFPHRKFFDDPFFFLNLNFGQTELIHSPRS